MKGSATSSAPVLGFTQGGLQERNCTAEESFFPSNDHCIGVERTSRPMREMEPTSARAVSSCDNISWSRALVRTCLPPCRPKRP